jgi:hypothetical protein
MLRVFLLKILQRESVKQFVVTYGELIYTEIVENKLHILNIVYPLYLIYVLNRHPVWLAQGIWIKYQMEAIVPFILFPPPKGKQENGKPFPIVFQIIILIIILLIIWKILPDTFRCHDFIMTITAIIGLFHRWQPSQIKPFISPSENCHILSLLSGSKHKRPFVPWQT